MVDGGCSSPDWSAGEFRPDLPREWLVTVCYSLFHAAAHEVREGRLDAGAAPLVIEAIVVNALTSRD